MMQAQVTDLRKKVADLKKSKDAIILAHNYQIPEVQDVADYVRYTVTKPENKSTIV